MLVVYQGVTSPENREGRKRVQLTGCCRFSLAGLADAVALSTDQPVAQRGEAFAHDAAADEDILTVEPNGETMQRLGKTAMAGAPLHFRAKRQIVDPLLPLAKLIPLADQDGFDSYAGHGLRGLHEAITNCANQALIEGVDAVRDFVESSRDEFGSGRRSGSAQVRDEVGNGEVGLMADRRDDRNVRICDGLGKEFRIKRREVFERASATCNDDDVDRSGPVEICNAGADLGCRSLALNQGRIEQNLKAGMTAIDDVDEVADHSAGG